MSRVLFDQNVPAPLRRALVHHQVDTAYARGWGKLANGDLLDAADADLYDVFVTGDQNIIRQQNLSGRRIAIVVLETNLWPIIKADMTRVAQAVDQAARGRMSFVAFPTRWSPSSKP